MCVVCYIPYLTKTRAVLGFRGLYLECLVYGGMFVACSVSCLVVVSNVEGLLVKCVGGWVVFERV